LAKTFFAELEKLPTILKESIDYFTMGDNLEADGKIIAIHDVHTIHVFLRVEQ
jgi:hypothetical protein